MNTFFLLLMAILPGLAITMIIYLRDLRKPEPSRFMLLSILYGVLSFFIALGIGYLLHKYTHLERENFAHQMIRAVIFVGLVEEGSKFLFLRGILFHNRHFREPFDGILYAVMVGMGFAMAENIIYVLNGGGGTAIIRMFTAVPAHAVFAVIMGFFLGEARVFPTSSSLYSYMALGFATFVHGYYDYFLFMSYVPGLWIQAIISLVIVTVLTHFAIKRRRDEILRSK
jgi:RsiW-degrading membrane proteinase PrsW (M82 family)